MPGAPAHGWVAVRGGGRSTVDMPAGMLACCHARTTICPSIASRTQYAAPVACLVRPEETLAPWLQWWCRRPLCVSRKPRQYNQTMPCYSKYGDSLPGCKEGHASQRCSAFARWGRAKAIGMCECCMHASRALGRPRQLATIAARYKQQYSHFISQRRSALPPLRHQATSTSSAPYCVAATAAAADPPPSPAVRATPGRRIPLHLVLGSRPVGSWRQWRPRHAARSLGSR